MGQTAGDHFVEVSRVVFPAEEVQLGVFCEVDLAGDDEKEGLSLFDELQDELPGLRPHPVSGEAVIRDQRRPNEDQKNTRVSLSQDLFSQPRRLLEAWSAAATQIVFTGPRVVQVEQQELHFLPGIQVVARVDSVIPPVSPDGVLRLLEEV